MVSAAHHAKIGKSKKCTHPLLLQDPKKIWRRRKHLEEQKKQEQSKRRESETLRPERLLVEVEVRKTTFFSAVRRRLILEFFAEHFMQLVTASGRPRPCSEMLNHVKNLLLLLSEQVGIDDTRIEEWRAQLHRVRSTPREPRKAAAQRGPLQLPPEEVAANWTLQSVEVDEMFKGRRLMRDAPPTMVVFHRVDEESETPDDDTDL